MAYQVNVAISGADRIARFSMDPETGAKPMWVTIIPAASGYTRHNP